MESLAAISLAANTVQFVELGSKVVKRLHDFKASQESVPKVFQSISVRLPLLVEDLNKCSFEGLPNEVENALSTLLATCQSQVERLAQILRDTLPAKDDSWASRNKKALLSIRREKEVDQIDKDLRHCIELLTFHHIIPHKTTSLQNADPGMELLEEGCKRICQFFQVPRKQVSHFVGREPVFDKLERAFQSTTIAVIQGMGGQGKTQVALEYCRRARNNGKYAGIFWVDAASEVLLRRSLENIAEVIKPCGRIFDGIDQVIAFVNQELEYRITPWLIVLDNHDDPTSFPNILDFLPSVNGHVLFTTRHADVMRHGTPISLTGMTEEESLDLFFHRVQCNRTDQTIPHAKEISKRLGYHPLALDQAAAYIHKRRRTLKLEDVVDHYKTRKNDILRSTPKVWEYRKKDEDQEISLSVFTTCELSFERLVQESHLGAHYSQLLSLLGFFHSGDISASVFSTFWESVKSSGVAPTWMTIFIRNGKWCQDLFEDALVELRDMALIEAHYRDQNGIIHLSLHPLIRDWIQIRTNFTEVYAQCLLQARMLEANLQLTRPDTFSWFSIEEAQALLSYIAAFEDNYEEFLGPQLQSEHVHQLIGILSTISNFLDSYARYAHAEKLLKLALSLLSRDGNSPKYKLLQLKSWEGSVSRRRHRYTEAEEAFHSVEKLCVEQKIGDTPERIRNSIGMAELLADRGDYDKARDLFREVAARASASLGKKHDLTIFGLENLASVLQYHGDFEEAAKIYDDLISLRLSELSPNHPLILFLNSSLAKVFVHLGYFKKAERMNRQCHTAWTKQCGPEHPWTLRNSCNLGVVLSELGCYHEAEAFLRSTMVSEERVYGREHAKLMHVLDRLAIASIGTGNLDQALQAVQRAISIREHTEGYDPTHTKGLFRTLALVLNAQGKHDEAEPMLRDVLVKRERAFGKDHFITLGALHDLALVLRCAGKTKDARNLLYSAWKGRQRVLAKDHPHIFLSAVEYARLMDLPGQAQEAKRILEEAKIPLMDALSEMHPIHKMIMQGLDRITAATREDG